TRRPLEPGTEVSHPGSTQRAETMPVSPTSPIRMATLGCYRNGATAKCDPSGTRDDVSRCMQISPLWTVLRANMKFGLSGQGTRDGARKVRQTRGGGAGRVACEISQTGS